MGGMLRGERLAPAQWFGLALAMAGLGVRLAPGVTAPPAGVLLNTPEAIAQNAQRLYQQVVVTRIMPLGNATQITDEERAVIAAWMKAGAKPE